MNPKTLLDQILPSAAQSADRLLTEVWPISAMWPIRTPVAILFGAVTARCFEGECCLTAAGKSSIVAVLDGVSFQGSSAQGTSPPPRRKIWCLGSLFRFSFRIASEPRPCCKKLQLRTYVDLREGRDFEGADAEVHHVLFPPSPSTTERGALTRERTAESSYERQQ